MEGVKLEVWLSREIIEPLRKDDESVHLSYVMHMDGKEWIQDYLGGKNMINHWM